MYIFLFFPSITDTSFSKEKKKKMNDPEECFRVAAQTLDLMDKFAGPIDADGTSLPGSLQFPPHPRRIDRDPKLLKQAKITPQPMFYVPHTEKDDDPLIGRCDADFEYVDDTSDDLNGNVQVNLRFDDSFDGDIESDDESDPEWEHLMQRARLKNARLHSAKQHETKMPVDDLSMMLESLDRKFGYRFYPQLEYPLTRQNPLFFDCD